MPSLCLKVNKPYKQRKTFVATIEMRSILFFTYVNKISYKIKIFLQKKVYNISANIQKVTIINVLKKYNLRNKKKNLKYTSS